MLFVKKNFDKKKLNLEHLMVLKGSLVVPLIESYSSGFYVELYDGVSYTPFFHQAKNP